MNSTDPSADDQYQVVALRYRPQAFGDLVGQGHVAQALSNAIESNRVGHAYLFTGARGVGKTSSARIFAKCLNCEQGPSPTPCNECDICQSVSVGEDVDVLEIDGASNRGIDEIRQLRSNAAIRPGRGRYKIYIIDEVHMLTSQAFNALLKTLEEPPAHVKFIFCTTDPQKIPITVLSRCQRYDFSPVESKEITGRLREIAENENVTAAEEALQLLARRANGSMRDSQSLLEQLFSFCGDSISVDQVHELLGTSDLGRIAEIASAMVAKDATTTMNLIHQSVAGGVDAGQLTTQILMWFRDMMTVHLGCGEEVLQSCSASDMDSLRDLGKQLGLQSMLAAVQILDNAVIRMQSSLHARVLLEVAAVRICNLENLESISNLVDSLQKLPQGKIAIERASADVKKKIVEHVASEETKRFSNRAEHLPAKPNAVTAVAPNGVAGVYGQPNEVDREAVKDESSAGLAEEDSASSIAVAVASDSQDSSDSSVPEVASQKLPAESGDYAEIYRSAMESMSDMTSEMALNFDTLEAKAADHIEVALFDPYHRTMCSKADRKSKIEQALYQLAGRKIRIDFVVSENATKAEPVAPTMTRAQQMRELHNNEFVKQAIHIFGGEVADYFDPKQFKRK